MHHVPITQLKGVGPKRAEILSNAGLRTSEDVLSHFPRGHEDTREIVPIRSLVPGRVQVVQGFVKNARHRWIPGGRNLAEAQIEDDTGKLRVTWFNQPYVIRLLPTEGEVCLSGKITEYSKRLCMINARVETPEKRENSPYAGRLLPIYSLPEGTGQTLFRALVWQALQGLEDSEDPLPEDIRLRHELCGFRQAMDSIHFPLTPDQYELGRRRLAFQEFLCTQLAAGLAKKSCAPSGIVDLSGFGKRFLDALPFDLTAGQRKALDQIQQDLSAPHPMRRLLQGEVGSGKTVIAAAAMAMAHAAGWQSCLMAPTEILAEQHYATLMRWFEPWGVVPSLLTGSLSRPHQKEIRRSLGDGESSVVVGTHALVSEETLFDRLGLVIIDEQHRFGVRHRWELLAKAKVPNLLLLSATPIPRSLAAALCGDLEFTQMEGSVHPRAAIQTFCAEEERREPVYRYVRSQLENGSKAFIVCPSISSGRGKSAEVAFASLTQGVMSGLPIGLLHGKLRPEERQQVISQFAQGQLVALVCTSIVEVGIDVPDADILVVEEAHRFGLAQLHQLRGRIGRRGQDALCILMGHPPSEEAEDRLKILSKTQDGYEIAVKDLEQRGPGELFGVQQHGLPGLRNSSLSEDLDGMVKARSQAQDILESDPSLSSPAWRPLKSIILSRYGERLPLSLI